MQAQYHISLNNEYEFKYLCARKSIEAFEVNSKKGSFPTRFTLIHHLIKEIIYSPIYISLKAGELALNTFRMCVNISKNKSFKVKNPFIIAETIMLQALIPVMCLVMRLSATILGFIYLPWSIRGWKLAESGESLSYLLWAEFFSKYHCQNVNKKVFENIEPTNAIFYLGKKRTAQVLEKHVKEQLQTQITTSFSAIFTSLILNDLEFFNKIYNFHLALDPNLEIGKHVFYPVTSEVKLILFRLNKYLVEEELADPEELCEQFWEELSPKEIHHLFIYSNFHLRSALLDGKLKSNSTMLETQLTQLKNLFSRRFGYGRAYFPSSLWDIQSHSCD